MRTQTATAMLHDGIAVNEAHIERQADGRYRVIWMGWWWGGDFTHAFDAVLCKYWCLEQSDEDAFGWVAQCENNRKEA